MGWPGPLGRLSLKRGLSRTTMVQPEHNHYGTLYMGAQDQHCNHNNEHNLSTTTTTSSTKVHKTNTTTIVYRSTTPAHLIHLHVSEQSHQHHGVQSAQEPNILKGCLLLDIFNSYIIVIHVRGYISMCIRVSVLGDG